MEFAYSTNGYTRLSLDESLARIAACGFKGVEILADMPHLNPLLTDNDVVREIDALLAKYNLKVSNINANTAACLYGGLLLTDEALFGPSLSSLEPSNRQRRIRYTLRAIDLAALWSSPCVSITSGRLFPGYPPEEAMLCFADSLKPILEYAEKKNIQVGIKYEPGLLIGSEQDFTELRTMVNSKKLGLNLDIGHASVIGEDIAGVILRHQERIWNIHIEDIRKQRHYHLIPGEGDIDFFSLLSLLQQVEYDRFLTVELYTCRDNPDEAAQKSLNFLNRQLSNLVV